MIVLHVSQCKTVKIVNISSSAEHNIIKRFIRAGKISLYKG